MREPFPESWHYEGLLCGQLRTFTLKFIQTRLSPLPISTFPPVLKSGILTHGQRTLSISILHLRGNWTHACCSVQPL